MEGTLFLPNLIGSVVVIIIVVVALIFIKNILIKKVAYRTRHEKQNTVDGLIFNLLQYVVIIAGVFAILTVNGIQVTGLLASLGIAATVVGLSLQDTFKDLFAGINIYSNNFYKVGDYVKYNGETCVVKFFNARITKFQSIATGSTYTVSNNQISSIEKMKKDTNISFYFDYDTDKTLVDESLNVVVEEMEKMPECAKASYMGLVGIDAGGVRYLIAMSAAPNNQFLVKIKAFNVAYEEFKKRNIAPQFDNDRDVVISDKSKAYAKAKVNKTPKKK